MKLPLRRSEKNARVKIDYHITLQKLAELKNELTHLEKTTRLKATQEMREMAKLGDFSENAAYQMAKSRVRRINYRILEIKDFLNCAVVIHPEKNKSSVELGHKVTVETNRQQLTYKILGSSETDPSQGVISHNSPLGSALMGRKIGEMIKIKLNNKEIEYKIIGVE